MAINLNRQLCVTAVSTAVLWLTPCAAQTFTDVTTAAGLVNQNLTWAGAWADYDGDGDPDLYLTSHLQQFNDTFSQLMRNNNDGTFSDVTVELGLEPRNGDIHGACWADLDGDRDKELVIGKSFSADVRWDELWRNDDGTHFVNVAEEAGINGPRSGRSFSAVDYDRDGDLDLFASLDGLMNSGSPFPALGEPPG